MVLGPAPAHGAPGRLISEAALRVAAAALALVAAAIHFLLAVADLIPGEPTQGALFALMGAGYLAGAAAVFLRRPLADALVLLYTIALILAYAASRSELPIEIIGITSKAAETLLALILGLLLWREAGRPQAAAP